jgi:colicin import membrane protein
MVRIIVLAGILALTSSTYAQNPRSQQGGRGEEQREAARQRVDERTQERDVRGNQPPGQSQQQRGQRDAEEQTTPPGQQRAAQARERAGQNEQRTEPQGHAYGRNKGDLQGRDFGQARAAAARSIQEKKAVTREVASEVEEGVRRTTTKIEEARENTENRRRRGEISSEEYERRMRRIDEIERETKRIEEERTQTKRVIDERSR